ncbi:MAG: hypothetical protein KTR16_10295 [Acidiferrobacterales bacterium]|nr:hypothetical protein [Acidiferrobacterales bacterium]
MKMTLASVILLLPTLTYALTPLLDSNEAIMGRASVASDATAASIAVTQSSTPMTVTTIGLLEPAMLESLEKVKAYIQGETVLTAAELAAECSIIERTKTIFAASIPVIELVFETIELFDVKHCALFTQGSKTDGGFFWARTSWI